MRIDIGGPTAGGVCIVVDVLRASSTIVTLLERGCQRIVIAEDIRYARKLRERLPDHLLCGEAGGTPPDGFDYGNSPVEFSSLDLVGKSVILATTNGTRTLAEVADGAAAVLVGCLLNRVAVARAALRLASESGADIAVVCAGDNGSGEDLAGAGAIIKAALEMESLLGVDDHIRQAITLSDAASAVHASRHADELRDLGLGEDVEYCARLDVSDVVPVVQVDEDGLLRIVCHPGV